MNRQMKGQTSRSQARWGLVPSVTAASGQRLTIGQSPANPVDPGGSASRSINRCEEAKVESSFDFPQVFDNFSH